MKKGFLALTLIALLALVPTAAFADTCAGGQLSLTNSTNVEACLTVGVNQVTLTDVFLNGVAQTDLKVMAFAWNTAVGETTADWTSVNTPPCPTGCGDGWNPYLHEMTADDNSSPNFEPDITWTFNGDPGTDFAIHIGAFPSGCSVWVSTRATEENPGSNNCGGSEVPEPASLTLLGTGLLGLGGMLRKKLRKKA